MYIRIKGKRLRLEFHKHLPWFNDAKGRRMQRLGDCDPPDTPHRRIRVREGLRPKTELEVIVHEIAHAVAWDADETFINQIGKDVSTILWRLGYRRTGK